MLGGASSLRDSVVGNRSTGDSLAGGVGRLLSIGGGGGEPDGGGRGSSATGVEHDLAGGALHDGAVVHRVDNEAWRVSHGLKER